MGKLVSYIRVSTQRQGASGLGLEAQKLAVETFARSSGHTIVAEVREIESGRRCDRPQLAHALALCRLHNATLCVAKLDRLARDVAFLASLMSNGLDFVCCDNPQANRLTVHILSAVAEDEARRISERTRVALAAAKARGVKLGGDRNHTLTVEERAKGSARGSAARRTGSRERAAAVLPFIQELKAAGAVTLQQIANGLNSKGIPTPTGKLWKPMQIFRVLNIGGPA